MSEDSLDILKQAKKIREKTREKNTEKNEKNEEAYRGVMPLPYSSWIPSPGSPTNTSTDKGGLGRYQSGD